MESAGQVVSALLKREFENRNGPLALL
jgi:hypothetical protein